MTKRRLGRSELLIDPLVLGGNVIGWTADESTSFAVLDAFVDQGLNAIDTADSYSRWVPGNDSDSEKIIGRWLKARGNRDRMLIFTKVGSDMGQGHKDLSAAWIVQEVEASLKRLQIDYIDLYQSHWFDPATPQDETLAAYAQLIEAGKVRYIGASNFDADQLGAALTLSETHDLPRYQSLQNEYNLYDRSAFEGPVAEQLLTGEVGGLTYFSLASGFLTGKYRTAADAAGKARGGGMGKYLDGKGLRILAALDAVSARTGVALSEIALAWVMAQSGVTAAIASATSVAQVESLGRAVRLQLSAEDLDALTEAGR